MGGPLGSILLGYGLQEEVPGLHLPRHLLAREEVHPPGNPKPGPFIGEVGPDLPLPKPPAEGQDALRGLQGQKAPLAQDGLGLFEVDEALQEAEEVPVPGRLVPGEGGAAVGVPRPDLVGVGLGKADLVPVVDGGASREGEEEGVGQLEALLIPPKPPQGPGGVVGGEEGVHGVAELEG